MGRRLAGAGIPTNEVALDSGRLACRVGMGRRSAGAVCRSAEFGCVAL